MKNKNLWLSLLITIGVLFLLTWLIPSTSYGNGDELVLGTVNQTGIWDIFYYLSMLPLWFGQNFIYILTIGVFYGVINYTGALRNLEEKIVSLLKKKEKVFLIISSVLFTIVAGFTGISFPLMLFVPFVVGIILSLGFNKVTALMATIVPILIGTMGSLNSTVLFSAINGYVENGLSFPWFKLALILTGLATVILYLHFTAKIAKGKAKEEIDEELLFIEKKDGYKKAKIWPVITAFSVILGFLILGMTPWKELFNTNIFEEFHASVTELKIGDFAIIGSFLGTSVTAFGNWDIFDVTALIWIITIVLILVYKIKLRDGIKAAYDGIVKMLPVAIIVVLSNMAFVFVSQSGILTTVINFIASLTEGINAFTFSLASFIGGAVVNESYLASNVTWVFNSILGETSELPLLMLIQQVMYGFAMLVAPTSIFLLAGLSYLEVDYKKWLKSTWLLLLILGSIALIVLTLAIAL